MIAQTPGSNEGCNATRASNIRRGYLNDIMQVLNGKAWLTSQRELNLPYRMQKMVFCTEIVTESTKQSVVEETRDTDETDACAKS